MSQRLETKIGSHFCKEFHVASALVAKVEIATDRDQLCVERSDEISRNEFSRCFLRTLLVEAHNECSIDTAFRKKLKFLVEVGKK